MAYGGEHNSPLFKAVDKIVEQTEKQKKIMSKLKVFVEKGLTQSRATESETLTAHHDISPMRGSNELASVQLPHTQHDDMLGELKQMDEHSIHLKKIITDHNKLIQNQNEILNGTKLTLERIGSHSEGSSGGSYELMRMKECLEKNPNDIKVIQNWVGNLFRDAANKAFL